MTLLFRASSSLVLLLVIAICTSAQNLTPGGPQQPQQQTDFKGLRIQPYGSFPPEPLLPAASAEIDSLLKQADVQGRQGNYLGALKTYEDALVRTSGPYGRVIDKAFVLTEKTRALLSLKKYSEASATAKEAADAFAQEQDAPDQVDVLVRVAAYQLAFGVNRDEATELLSRALKVGQAETLRPGKVFAALRDAGAIALRSHGANWSRTFSLAALDLARKFANGSKELGYISYDLAVLAFESGNFAEAEVKFQENLALWNQLSEKATHNLARINRQLQSVDQNDNFLVQGHRQLVQEASDHLAYLIGRSAGCQMRLAEIAQQQGNPLLAHQWLDEASRTLQKGNKDPRLAGEVLRLKAVLKMDEGGLSAAGNDLFQAFQIANESGDPIAMIRCESELGRLALLQFNYSSAETYLRVAQAGIDNTGNDALSVAANRKVLGQAYALWGWSPDDPTNQQRAQRNLGLALNIYEQYEMPLEIAEVKLIRGSFGVNPQPEMDQKDLDDAREILTRLAPRSVLMAKLLMAFAYQEDASGKHEAARPKLLAAREILRKSAPRNIALAAIEHNLMVSARANGNLAEAEKLGSESWQLVRRIAPEFAGEDAGESYSSVLANYGASLAFVQLALKKNDAALLTLELTRARGLFQLLSQRKKLSDTQWREHQNALSARYQAEGDFYRSLIARNVVKESVGEIAPSDDSPEATAKMNSLRERDQDLLAAETKLALATARADDLWRNLMENSQPDAAPEDLYNLQKGLAKGTVFLLFARDRNNLLVFALRADSPEIVTVTIDVEAPVAGSSRFNSSGRPKLLADLVFDFRDALDAEPGDIGDVAMQGELIFNTLFPGRLRSIVLNADRLVISPEAVLWQLPFAALVSGRKPNQEPDFLGLLKPITYTQSLSLYLTGNAYPGIQDPKRKPVALVIGDPVFDLRGTPDFVSEKRDSASAASDDRPDTVWASLASRAAPPARLTASRLEATGIACLFQASPVLGNDAREERVRQEIEGADVIHLATHSQIDDDAPMSSGILLSPPAKDPPFGQTINDGALQAWEIFSQMRLRADLAVLSACNTALGRSVRGEGIIGLTRALQYAGVRSIVASQWEVDDPSTNVLMRAFYNSLHDRKSKDEALRQAMLKVAGDKTTAHPHYWAAFTLTGGSTNSILGGTSKTRCN